MPRLNYLRAGELDRLVTINTKSDSVDADYGAVTESSAELAQVWAMKEELRGRELFEAQQISAEITTKWTIRYRSDVSRKHEIVYDGVTYDIEHIAEIGRRVGLEILTIARVT